MTGYSEYDEKHDADVVKSPALNVVVEEFFYTTVHPNRWWAPGLELHTMTYEGEYFTSLEEAKQAADEFRVEVEGLERCITTYGVRYITH